MLFILSLLFVVRHKAKEILELIQNDERLREERKKAKKNKDKYQGMSGDSMSRYSYSMYSLLVLSKCAVFNVFSDIYIQATNFCLLIVHIKTVFACMYCFFCPDCTKRYMSVIYTITLWRRINIIIIQLVFRSRSIVLLMFS